MRQVALFHTTCCGNVTSIQAQPHTDLELFPQYKTSSKYDLHAWKTTADPVITCLEFQLRLEEGKPCRRNENCTCSTRSFHPFLKKMSSRELE
mmetsp:Transcript_51505/g.137453  ORF Transcript_51505/g.137453 Transcript_51505/m.137453 type:complete len:93 (-) Transcript_51505:902-1180(-)